MDRWYRFTASHLSDDHAILDTALAYWLFHYADATPGAGKYPGGAPELAIEISASGMSRDFGIIKLELYRKAGVREYLTILLQPKQVIWRHLVRERYKELVAHEDGLLKSQVFPGLLLDTDAVWNPAGRLRKVAEAGLKSPEHPAFVQQIKSGRRPRKP